MSSRRPAAIGHPWVLSRAASLLLAVGLAWPPASAAEPETNASCASLRDLRLPGANA